MDEFNNKKPPTPLLISYDPELIRKQAADSTRRFEEGQEFSDLDASCFLNINYVRTVTVLTQD